MEEDEKPVEAPVEDVVESNAVEDADQPKEAETADDANEGAAEEEKSRSQRQRERRRALLEQHRQQAEEATKRLERIKSSGSEGAPPKDEDFLDPSDYVAAKAVYEYSKHSVAREQAMVSEEIKAIQAQQDRVLSEDFRAREMEAASRYQDYERVTRNPDLAMTESMVGVLKEIENGPDVVYALGLNPAESTRISRLPTHMQAAELGRMSATISQPKPKMQSTAPAPIRPVGGSAKAARDPAKMSSEEYRAWRANGGGS